MMNEILCLIAVAALVGDQPAPMQARMAERSFAPRMAVCVEVAAAAAEIDLDPALAVAVAYEESGFDGALVSKVGARGPLQIMPAHHCPRRRLEGCDLVGDAVATLAWFVAEYPDTLREALCHYNEGNECSRASYAYAHRVELRAASLRAQWTAATALDEGSGDEMDAGGPVHELEHEAFGGGALPLEGQ